MKTQKNIYIKRKIQVNDYLKQFIFSNINYRRKIWNLFVEEYYKCNEDWDKFKISEIASNFTHNIDKERRYNNEYYASDIVKSVYLDINEAMKRIKKRTIEEHKHFSLRFKSFDRYKGAFRVRTRNELNSKYQLNGKVHIKDDITFQFRASKDNHFNITLKESLYDEKIGDTYRILDKHKNLKCYFHDEDIKQIVFIHELGQFYISLCIKVTYINKKKDIKNRNELAGIDLGIRNPITLYDGNDVFSINMGNKKLNRIHYLERRCKRLQNIMDRKMEINKKKHKLDPTYNIYTRSYERVRRKFRRTWKRIYDIRLDWRRKTAKIICTSYQNIVVDKFKQPTKDDHENLHNKSIRNINHFNREYGMSLFTGVLVHDCKKYGCNFIEAPKHTTRTCSYCGHKNPKLPLSQRIFKCEECGYTDDRDANAAINCYDSYQNHC